MIPCCPSPLIVENFESSREKSSDEDAGAGKVNKLSGLSYPLVCQWYNSINTNFQDELRFELGLSGENEDPPLPRFFDYDAFVGLLLHCAYLTRL